MFYQISKTLQNNSSFKVFIFILFFRIFNSISIKTFSQPDEYWQCLEPAHKLVYGYGYDTWEWKQGIRSSLHPVLFAGVYKLIDLLGLSNTNWIITAPRILQAIFAALGDIGVYKYSSILYSKKAGMYTLIISLTSAYNWFFSVRTFSNSLEQTLTVWAWVYWPWDIFHEEIKEKNVQKGDENKKPHEEVKEAKVKELKEKSEYKEEKEDENKKKLKTTETNKKSVNMAKFAISTTLTWIACILRPTNIILWIIPGFNLVYVLIRNHKWKDLLKCFVTTIFTLSVIFYASFQLDSWFFGRSIFPFVEFIKFNFFQNLSSFYGTNRLHYYIIEALPLFFIGYLPIGLYALMKNLNTLQGINTVFVIFCYTLISHKEARFIYPLLPCLHAFIGSTFTRIRVGRVKSVIIIAIIINLPVAYYLTCVHQSGVIDVANYIRENNSVKSVGFITPCHSTPWQSYFHRPDIDAWFITCEPPINLSTYEKKIYMDESDILYKNPKLFINQLFPDSHNTIPAHLKKHSLQISTKNLPTHLVLFSDLLPTVYDFLKLNNYSLEKQFFNSLFHEDSRRKGKVLVFSQRSG